MLNELLRAVAGGDRRAFRQLYDLTSGPLYSILLGTIGHPQLAEEVLQESFLKIWQKAGAFDPSRGQPMPWLATLVRNQARDVLRARRPDEFCSDMDPDWIESAGEGTDPGDELECAQQISQLRAPLAALPTPVRTGLLLTCYAGYTHHEAAEIMGTPLGTLKSWVRRGLQQLRRDIGLIVPDADAA